MGNIEYNYDEIVKKWDDLYFLENVKNKRNVAMACEFNAKLLINKIECGKLIANNIDVFSFPAIIKIFRDFEEDLTIDFIIKKVSDMLTNLSDLLSGLENDEAWINRVENKLVDVEAATISAFCEDFIKNKF